MQVLLWVVLLLVVGYLIFKMGADVSEAEVITFPRRVPPPSQRVDGTGLMPPMEGAENRSFRGTKE